MYASPDAALLVTFPALDNTLGAVLVGSGVSSVLAGVFLHQIFRYFRRYPKDHWSSKATIFILCVLDLFHEALIIHLCYYYMVSNYFRPSVLVDGVWSLRLIIPTTGVIVIISHMFYARRVIILADNKRLVVPIVIISMILIGLEIAFCTVTTCAIFRNITFKRFAEDSSWLISTGLGISVLTDLLITGAMVVMLRRSRTGFKRTDSILDVLMLFAINTGLLASVVNLASVITALVLPDALIYCAIYLVASKLYSNSVVAVLNSRRSRKKNRVETQNTETSWLEMNDLSSAVCRSDTNAEVTWNNPATA
ncbi:hypothetical protein LXA43DRAFT_292497 [Ganoderma leucocontextum]|nr:hypothetical protein LXA43DRAFT_292497 [Ganoderma leucocontextum]